MCATLLCGKGNNAGDAYVAGVYLLEKGYKVQAYQVAPIEDSSDLCQKNYHRFQEKGGQIVGFTRVDEIDLKNESLLVDALFGTGFKGEAKGIFAKFINKANSSNLPIIAVDIPSGLDGESGIVEGRAIKAAVTVFLGLPKTGFFLQDGWKMVGKLRFVDFGLPHSYIDEFDAEMEMLSIDMVKGLLPKIAYDRHKYQAGLVIGLAGSIGMPGAAMLASTAALRGGAGIVRLLHPKGMETELSNSPYELIKIGYGAGDEKMIIETLNSASACFIGPGIGRGKEIRELIKKVLPNIEKPCVIDADALTIIAEEKIKLPPGVILTPHKGEMIRLLQKSSPQPSSKEFLQYCQKFSDEKRVTLVLKGGPSFIFHPQEKVLVSPYGDPGMATAGSGDVLTGLIAALLAQKLSSYQAAMLAVYLHGIAGEMAAIEKSSYCMIASDIIDKFPTAFRLH